MSQENVEAVRRQHEHFSRTGKPLAEVCAPDVQWTTAREDPDSDTYCGLAEVERLFDNWTGMFPGLRVESDEYLEADDKVFTWVRLSGAGGGSGAGVMMEQAQVWTFRDGKAIRVEEYFDRVEALEATGLRE
jgi:ketosteroid isomerase-like protein